MTDPVVEKKDVLPGAAPDAGVQAVPPEHKEEEAAPEFDPSKIDVNDPDVLSGLTDDQIATVSEYNKEHGTEVVPPAKAGETTEEGGGTPAKEPEPAPVKYAGKYDTIDDLGKGVIEIAKKLSVPEWTVQAALDSAKESGKYGVVEALYKRMEQELGTKSTQPAPAAAPAAPVADTATEDTPDPKLMAAVDQLTLSEMARSPLAQQMAARSISLPRNVKEFDDLVDAQPFYAAEFRRVYEETFGRNLEVAQGALKARKEVEGSNKQIIDSDTASLKAVAAQFGFALSDAEVEAVKAEALSKPWNYETKFGVRFLRSGAVKEHFLATKLSDKIAEIKVAAETAGRTQAVADLKKAGDKTVQSISTSRLSTKTRTELKMPDITDPDVLAQLPDEALNDPEKWFLAQGYRK